MLKKYKWENITMERMIGGPRFDDITMAELTIKSSAIQKPKLRRQEKWN